MKKTKSKFSKNIEVMLPPGDVGPLCTYRGGNCSPSDTSRNLSLWREAQFSMTAETDIDDPTPDEERQLINTWILQLVYRELTQHLQAAEAKLNRPLQLDVGVCAAEVIHTALALRAPRPKPAKQSK